MKVPGSLLPRLGAALLLFSGAVLALVLDGVTIAPAKATLPDRITSETIDPALPTFPGAKRSTVGREMIVNGQRMNLDVAYTETSDLGAIAEHYERALRDTGLVPRVSRSEEGLRISALSPDGRQYAVEIESFQGGAMILPSVTRGVVHLGASAKEVGLPLPADRAALLQSVATDGTRRSKNVQFVAALDLEEIFAFYHQALAASGWSLAGDPLQDDRLKRIRMQNFRRADHRLRLSARDMEEGGTLVMLLEEWTKNTPEESP